MATHLAGKVSRLISDFLTLQELTGLIEHEMEKRIVARHGLVKLDSLLKLLPRLKNELRDSAGSGSSAVARLEELIRRLRKDYEKSGLETGRDALAAHSLKLDLRRIVDTWTLIGQSVFAILADDLRDIDAELGVLSNTYPRATTWWIDPHWPHDWATDDLLGDPGRPRMAIIYAGLATAGIISALPGGHATQDATIRASGLLTFIVQTQKLAAVAPDGTPVQRLFAEMLVNDYCALWEALFTSGVANEHGVMDKSVSEHWNVEGFGGAACLAQLQQHPHKNLNDLRENVRNKFSAHTDPDAPIWEGDVDHWPLTYQQIVAEAFRVINEVVQCAMLDIRSRALFIKPQAIGPDGASLTAQTGKRWSDS